LFSVTGSEAVQGALRIARATTGRTLIVKFEGHYHGWLDPMYANANGAITGDVGSARYALRPNCKGQFVSEDMLAVTRFHDKDAFDELMSEIGHRVAAVVLEPIPFNFGAYLPDVDYLTHLRAVTKRYGSMLIFDEVVSGFRVARGGAQSLLGVTPDLATFAKAMASGFPVSMIAGSHDAMSSVKSGAVRHAGTYNAAPTSLAATLATASLIADSNDKLYQVLDDLGSRLQRGIDAIATSHSVPLQLNRVGSVSQLFWGAAGSRRSYESCCTSDSATVAAIAETAADHGVHIAPRGLMFLGTRHTPLHVDRIISAIDASVRTVLVGAER
jgi:glutamate-1-semialdehyde 2,1-aminomutase